MQLSHGGAIVISFRVHIRRAGIADESVDLVISNCVVNLSPDKQRVIREAYRVLRPGGEMHFSDVYADRRVPADLQTDEVSGCRPPCCKVASLRQISNANPMRMEQSFKEFAVSGLRTHTSCPGLQVIWGECIAGALYINDFLRIAKEAGFADPRILHQGPVAIHDHDIQVLSQKGGSSDACGCPAAEHWCCSYLQHCMVVCVTPGCILAPPVA